MNEKLKVAIIGTGNIGTDLLIKLKRSNLLECVCFIGRNKESKGMLLAQSLGMQVSDEKIDWVLKHIDTLDILFDVTTAVDASYHWSLIKKYPHIKVIDLTPSNNGIFCVPSININQVTQYNNVNMISCGAQASLPIIFTICQVVPEIDYIEMINNVSSKSVGPGTRCNVDEYIETTELALSYFADISESVVKALLNVNPAEPPINMQTTIYVKAKALDLELLNLKILKVVEKVKKYVPGYALLVPPIYKEGILMISIKTIGLGDFLPPYAGNLDIINCAAIAVAERFSELHFNLT